MPGAYLVIDGHLISLYRGYPGRNRLSVFTGAPHGLTMQVLQAMGIVRQCLFRGAVADRLPAWRHVVQTAVGLGIPVPGFSASLAYYDSYRSERLPANLLQAQRDYFGAHTYERVDRPRGEFSHTNWTGHGGATASTSYTA